MHPSEAEMNQAWWRKTPKATQTRVEQLLRVLGAGWRWWPDDEETARRRAAVVSERFDLVWVYNDHAERLVLRDRSQLTEALAVRPLKSPVEDEPLLALLQELKEEVDCG